MIKNVTIENKTDYDVVVKVIKCKKLKKDATLIIVYRIFTVCSLIRVDFLHGKYFYSLIILLVICGTKNFYK